MIEPPAPSTPNRPQVDVTPSRAGSGPKSVLPQVIRFLLVFPQPLMILRLVALGLGRHHAGTSFASRNGDFELFHEFCLSVNNDFWVA